MEQNINFLTTLNIQVVPAFNTKLMTQIIGGWILLLLLIYTFSFVININSHKTLIGLESEQKSFQVHIDNLNKELELLDSSRSFHNIPITSANLIGFYGYLKGLASVTPNNTWLNELLFSQTDNLILLKGNTITAANIPIFIDALKKSDVFNDKKFHALQLQKIPNSNNVSFTLSTQLMEIN